MMDDEDEDGDEDVVVVALPTKLGSIRTKARRTPRLAKHRARGRQASFQTWYKLGRETFHRRVMACRFSTRSMQICQLDWLFRRAYLTAAWHKVTPRGYDNSLCSPVSMYSISGTLSDQI